MSKNLKLVINRPSGFKTGQLLTGGQAKLVNPETGEEVPGVSNIAVNFNSRSPVKCTAEIHLSDIQFVEDRSEPIVIEQPEPGNGESSPQ